MKLQIQEDIYLGIKKSAWEKKKVIKFLLFSICMTTNVK